MRYILLNQFLLIDLDQYYAFEIEGYVSSGPFGPEEGSHCISCHDIDKKSVFKIRPTAKTSRAYCVELLKKIADIKRTPVADRPTIIEVKDIVV